MTLVTSGQAASFCEAKDACEAALVQALAALDIRRRPSLPCSYQWRENSRELCSDSGSWIQATIACSIERVCKKRGAGVVRVTCVLTRLSPWSQAGTIRSSWRGFQALMGRCHGIGFASVARWQRHVAFATHATPLANRARTRTLRGAKSSSCGAISKRLRSTRWGPDWVQRQVWLRRRFFVRLKSGSVSPSRPTSRQAPRANDGQ